MKTYNDDRDNVIKILQSFYGFNKKQAVIIESFAYEQLHAFWDDYLNGWEDFADLILDVNKAKYSE